MRLRLKASMMRAVNGMDEKSRKMYLTVSWVSGLTIIVVLVYGFIASLSRPGGVLEVGETFVNIDFPFPPYFAKPVSYLAVALVAFFYSSLRLWEERIARWPRPALSALQLLGFITAFSSAYEVMYNFMLWGALYSVEFLKENIRDPNLIFTPFAIPWNLVFATKIFSALFVVSGYTVYFIRRLNVQRVKEPIEPPF